MAEKRIDVNRLGGDAVQLKGTSIGFVEVQSPMMEAINNYVVEGEENKIEVFKTLTDSYRPFLIIENDALHAKIALYMSLKFTDARIEADNRIRGEHVFRTPYAMASYIGSSAIKGTHDPLKNSIIDRDRFLFLNEDEFVDMDSRAKDKDEFEISLTRHARNIQHIRELLNIDLADHYFENMVRSGASSLWTYKKGAGEPVIYNPAAMYLKTFVNAAVGYSNPKHKLSADSLGAMASVAQDAVKAYAEYQQFFAELSQLEKRNPALYKALQNVRYYTNMITPASYEAMAENAGKFKFGKYEWRYIYGDAIKYENLPVDERIMLELSRGKVAGGVLEKNNLETIQYFLREESSLQNKLSRVVDEVIGFLTSVNAEERLIITDFAYDEKFWTAFYAKMNLPDYIPSLCEDFKQKYLHLSYLQQEHLQFQKKKKKLDKELARKQASEIDAIKSNLAARTKEFARVLNDHHLELYSRAFNQYTSGKLLPISLDEIESFRSLTQPVGNLNSGVKVGTGLSDKFLTELRAMQSMAPIVESYITLALTAEKRIAELEKTKGAMQLVEIMAQASTIEQKVVKQNKSLSAKQRKPLVKKEIKNMISNLDEDDLLDLVDPDFDYGFAYEEILASMQDIYHSKSVLRAYINLKQKKLQVIEALSELNDPELLNAFASAAEAVGELAGSGVDLPIMHSVQSIEAIKLELDQLAKKINTSKMQTKDYDELIEVITGKVSQMKKFIDFSKRLQLARADFYNKLDTYEMIMAESLLEVTTIVDVAIEENIEAFKKELFDPHKLGYYKTETGWEQRDQDGKVIATMSDESFKTAMDAYSEGGKDCLDPEVFADVQKDKELLIKLFYKAYPTREELVRAVKKAVANASSMENAVKEYNNFGQSLEKLISDKDLFIEIMGEEYKELIYCSQDLIVDKGAWQAMFKSFGWGNAYVLENPDADEDVRDFLAAAEVRACQKVLDQIDGELSDFLSEIRKRAFFVVENLESRAGKFVDLVPYLSKSTVKASNWRGVIMPKAVVGQNGITAMAVGVAEQKRKNSDLLGRYIRLLNYETMLRGKYESIDELSPEERQIFNEMLLKPSEISFVESCTAAVISQYMDGEVVAEQKRQIQVLSKDFLESVRLFGKLGQGEYDYIMDKDGFEKAFNEIFGKKGSEIRKLHVPLRRRTPREVEGVDYIDFYTLVIKNLPVIRKRLKEDDPFEGGKYDEQLTKAVSSLYLLFKASTPEARKMAESIIIKHIEEAE